MDRARFAGFYKLPVEERLRALQDREWIDAEAFEALRDNLHVLDTAVADKMIENVVGVMGLPLGLGLNFLINDREFVVPLVVEEPSIVAALSSAARIFGPHGGIRTESDESLLIGQIQVVDIDNMAVAVNGVRGAAVELVARLNRLHPNMVTRGGGVTELEVRTLEATADNPAMMVVHLLVDTCDAMGANIVNTMCEELAPDIERLTGGRVCLRILSNLTDRALVRARVSVPAAALANDQFSGEEVRDGIVLAAQFAWADPYRAATHNKGIMNGIDPVAVATGNDWRAIEAAAHAYAARDGQYRALSRWHTGEDGNLVGEIEIPMKVGTQGGSLQANRTVGLAQQILGLDSARDLAEVMGAIGLAQNFSALKALATEGIQSGHMSLHARSVAVTANTPTHLFEDVVARLIDERNIKVSRAEELIREFEDGADAKEAHATGTAAAKVILLGEHAVVYGHTALALPLEEAVTADISAGTGSNRLQIPGWNVDLPLHDDSAPFAQAVSSIFEEYDIPREGIVIRVNAAIPPAMGLGGSAACAVAVIRALSDFRNLGLDQATVNALAFRCERASHGTPSGIDNTIATYGTPLSYQSAEQARFEPLAIGRPLNVLVAMSKQPGLTVDMVAGVRERRRRYTQVYDSLFNQVDSLARGAIRALADGAQEELGALMNVNHGLLCALEVSTPELDAMVQTARDNGALGAKLTGAGGGGSIVALCGDDNDAPARALQRAGYRTFSVVIPASDGTGTLA